jgi:hypothetical protein
MWVKFGGNRLSVYRSEDDVKGEIVAMGVMEASRQHSIDSYDRKHCQ